MIFQKKYTFGTDKDLIGNEASDIDRGLSFISLFAFGGSIFVKDALKTTLNIVSTLITTYTGTTTTINEHNKAKEETKQTEDKPVTKSKKNDF